MTRYRVRATVRIEECIIGIDTVPSQEGVLELILGDAAIHKMIDEDLMLDIGGVDYELIEDE